MIKQEALEAEKSGINFFYLATKRNNLLFRYYSGKLMVTVTHQTAIA
ncbi:hypothetical protein H6G97_23210 [Nostoc flagelliforme FACHB-838]|uniref:Uncharacterized protein n=1 Tax=Nostoc flagelliforme FACHB-838 TaxID=2692904 RepID=A0ABR8DSX7_9NOSO|nr:hypothetical protein [Nostoc flagelliforme]MBD2532328.1 hypothetical protein [Nostoc flagelliforme FACHB-838]